MRDKSLVFKLWGDYAHYRKIYTTTSPLTYAIPTRTSLAGLVAGIIGLEKDSYHKHFSSGVSGFGIQLLKSVDKTTINLNLTDTKYGDAIPQGRRTQIPFEFVKNPEYKIYVNLEDDELHNKLKGMLESGESYYTPCLGLSECLANIEYRGEQKTTIRKVDGEILVNTVIDTSRNNLVLNEGCRYGREKIPLYMDEKRNVLGFGDIVYKADGKGLTINSGEYAVIGGDNIVFI